MARYTFPRLFELEMASAIGSRKSHNSAGSLTHGFDTHLGGSFNFPQEWEAVALRWRLSPYLGIPAQPFNVYRRISDSNKYYKRLGVSKQSIHNTSLSINSNVYYDIVFVANNIFGSPAIIQALDENQNAIIGEVVSIPVGGNTAVRFRAPNIAYLKVTNSVELSGFKGITMQEMVNLKDWELFERVGLPYKKGQVPNNIYNSNAMQGRITQPLEGDAACKFRVDLAKLFYQAPPTNDAGINIDPIKAPKGKEVYKEITDGSESLLKLLTEMFDQTSQGSFTKRQIQYTTKIKGDGIHQSSSSVSTADSVFEVPLAGTTLLSASMDMWACLGLGFGTTDIVDLNNIVHNKYFEPNRFLRVPYDYMVTSKFVLPGNIRREFAALSRFNAFPDVVQTPLQVAEFLENRPLKRDDPFSEDLELKWLRVPNKILPSSYIFAKTDDGLNARIISEKRPFTNNGHYAFIPAVNPSQDASHQVIASYMDHENKVPFIGSRNLTYFKVATDVFGRWSNWVKDTHTLSSNGPSMPAILKVEFKIDKNPTPINSKSFNGNLEIELAWDWDDRSPKAFQIAGKFIDPTIDPGTVAPGGFQINSGGGFGPIIQVNFISNNINHHPQTSDPTKAKIKKLPNTPDDGLNRKYLLTVFNIKVDFAVVNRHGFAAYAKASERVNPVLFSGYCSPKKAQVNNPLPADPINIPGPDINWTALPDATGFARYQLSFPTAPGAVGYVLYEATELALRDAIGLPTLNTTNMVDRANALLGNAANVRTKDAFIRKNRELLLQPKVTVNLPAVASGLYVYCISSITSEQVESEKSNWLLVAVPHRTTPAPPILSAKNVDGGIQLSVEPYGSTSSRSIELYRTRSEILVTDINVMGKPVAYDNDPRWEKLDEDGVAVGDPTEYPALYRLEDNVNPSWMPYYYRAAAFGDHDPSNGVIKGRSKSSNLIKITALPTNPPDLTSLAVSKSGSLLKVSFKSKAERWNCPLGAHTLQLLTIDRAATTFQEDLLINSSLPNIEEKTSNSPTLGEFRRVSLDGNKRWLYEGYIDMTEHEIIVRMIDPKYRQSELRTKYVAPPTLLKLDLVSLLAKRNTKRLLVTFKSSVPVSKPIRGSYLLEIFETSGRGSSLLLQRNIHDVKVKRLRPISSGINLGNITLDLSGQPTNVDLTIGTSRPPTSLNFRKTSITRSSRKDIKGRYSYTAIIPNLNILTIPSFLKNRVIVKISMSSRKSIQKTKTITKG